MRRLTPFLILAICVVLSSCNIIPDAISGATRGYDANGNSFYHRTDETKLQTGNIVVEGEVKTTGLIRFKRYLKREVLHKQATLNAEGKIDFVGAYRYRGYSLFDLLNPFILDKKNAEEFVPATDVYIIIENNKGERVTFSWAEIYLSHTMHQVIIATEQASIEPYKRKVDYPKGSVWKVVASGDLFAYRELENPTKIIVKSFDRKHYPIDRDLEDPYSPTVNLVFNDELKCVVEADASSAPQMRYKSVFYGMGMGYHDTPYFEGPMLSHFVNPHIEQNYGEWMRNGLAFIVGKDGFRNVVSVSELFNRVDQVEPILAIPPVESGRGHFRLYHPSAFYADFSVRNLAEIYFFQE
ncbi:MAG: hypothetical protein RBT19_09835 [Tenuifilaceae bacterium]|jgi:hypothetical protein|nr:hypothetical protein [Tenuifilaceae bacterium]